MAENATLASRTRPHLPAPEVAALALSLAHLGAGPQSATARRALRRLFDDLEPAEAVGTTLDTLSRPLHPATAHRARTAAAAITARLVLRRDHVHANGS